VNSISRSPCDFLNCAALLPFWTDWIWTTIFNYCNNIDTSSTFPKYFKFETAIRHEVSVGSCDSNCLSAGSGGERRCPDFGR
jgi:hypothetical protein